MLKGKETQLDSVTNDELASKEVNLLAEQVKLQIQKFIYNKLL